MSDVISEYHRWKQQGEDLRTQARQAMESRFRDLLNTAVQIAEEYRADFGSPLKPPPVVTSFRYKASAKVKKGKPSRGKPAPAPAAAKAAPPKAEPAPPAKPNKKVVAIEKKLAVARKKLEDAKAAGTPTRALEDRIYEIEDDLRLANQA